MSPITVHIAGRATLSSCFMYDPYTTMNVPPSESEKIAWPIAAIITVGVRSAHRNFRMYQRTPAIAPGSVSDRIISSTSATSSTGMTHALARSIPALNPFATTTAQASATIAVKHICSANDVKSNPCSGGRIADASMCSPTPAPICATA